MSLADRNEFRWYLEEFILFPFGAELKKAEKIEQKIIQWGELLFRNGIPFLGNHIRCSFSRFKGGLF